MPNSTNRGGSRPGSGRKALPEHIKKSNYGYRLSAEGKIAVDAMLKSLRQAKKQQKIRSGENECV